MDEIYRICNLGTSYGTRSGEPFVSLHVAPFGELSSRRYLRLEGSAEIRKIRDYLSRVLGEVDESADEDGIPWADRCTAEDPCPVRAARGGLSCDH
jgi:hypothetical protein